MAILVREILRQAGTSQARMAVEIGMSPSQLSRKISGRRRTQVEEAQSIAAYLSRVSGREIRVEDLFPPDRSRRAPREGAGC